jgi:hypothetical protein
MSNTDPKPLPTTFEDVFDGLAFEALQIMYERQRKYGPENIRQQGLWGVWQRIRADKMARIDRSFNGRVEFGQIILDAISDDFGDETWEDTLFDISNLSLIMIAVKRGVWGLPLRENTDEVKTLAADHPDGVPPQLTLTPEEKVAERARAALAGEPMGADDFLAALDDLSARHTEVDLSDIAPLEGGPEDEAADAWDREEAAAAARQRLAERQRRREEGELP